MLQAVNASFDPIKKFLVALATEFSNRDEYNAFKHALRIMPMLQNVHIGPPGSTKPTVQIIAEPNTNSVIINAPAALIRTLKRVIKELDII